MRLESEDFDYHKEVLPLIPTEWATFGELKKAGFPDRHELLRDLYYFGKLERKARAVWVGGSPKGDRVEWRRITEEVLR